MFYFAACLRFGHHARKSNTHQRSSHGPTAVPVPNRQSRASDTMFWVRKDVKGKFCLLTVNKQKLKKIKNICNSCQGVPAPAVSVAEQHHSSAKARSTRLLSEVATAPLLVLGSSHSSPSPLLTLHDTPFRSCSRTHGAG